MYGKMMREAIWWNHRQKEHDMFVLAADKTECGGCYAVLGASPRAQADYALSCWPATSRRIPCATASAKNKPFKTKIFPVNNVRKCAWTQFNAHDASAYSRVLYTHMLFLLFWGGDSS